MNKEYAEYRINKLTSYFKGIEAAKLTKHYEEKEGKFVELLKLKVRHLYEV